MWDVGRSVSPPRDPGRLVEQRRAERARGVPQPQRALEPEQQPGLPLCRAHDGAGWLPPEQTGVLSVVSGGGECRCRRPGTIALSSSLARTRCPANARSLPGRFSPRTEKCRRRVIFHERGLTLSSTAFPRPGRRNGERIDCMVPGVRLRSATSSSAFAGSLPVCSGWGRRRTRKGGFRQKDRSDWSRSIPASGYLTRLAPRLSGKP